MVQNISQKLVCFTLLDIYFHYFTASIEYGSRVSLVRLCQDVVAYRIQAKACKGVIFIPKTCTAAAEGTSLYIFWGFNVAVITTVPGYGQWI